MTRVALALTMLLAAGRLDATTLDVCTTKTISAISVANPTVITTTAAHNLVNGQTITISGSNSTPTVNGSRVATVTGSTTFTVPVNVTSSGNAGTVACTYSDPQAAITAAASGDTIVLQPGDTFTGNYTFPNKGNASVITIKSNASAGNLPGVGVRTSPAYAAYLPKIQASVSGTPAFQFLAGAQKYTVENLEFPGTPGGFGEIISIGYGDASQYLASQEPTTIVLDRLYIHADPVTGQKRAVGFNANILTLKNSYVSNIHAIGQDSQCVQGFNGTGTYTITNNYLECGAENIMFGGADPPEHIFLTVTGSSTPTGAAVATAEAGHTLAELASGQLVSVETAAGVVEHTTLTAQPGSGTTGTLAWSPAVSVAPAVGLRIRAGVVAKTITITGNDLTKQLVWMTDGVLTKPTGLTATPSTASGTLPAGTYWYRVQKFSTAGYNNTTVNSDVSAEVSATLNATGKVDLAWPDSAGETSYRVWCFTASGQTVGGNYLDVAANSTTFTDTGSIAWVTGNALPGTRPTVKNLLELKAAQSVTISGNVLENHFKGAQSGYAMWLKSVNQDGNCWWCQTRDVTIENNVFRHVDGWLLVSARESGATNPRPPSMTNVTIRHNLVYDSNSNYSQGAGAPNAMLLVDGSTNLTIEHNTVVHLGNALMVFSGLVHTGLSVRNNLFRKEFYGVRGDGTGDGSSALDAFAPGAVFTKNAIADANCSLYPAGNFCEAAALWESEFVSYSFDGTNADYHLKTTSQYHNAATDAIDLGADLAAIATATAGAVVGTSTSPPIITTSALPNAVRTVVYPSTTLQAIGGTTPYTWSVNAGSTLPTGLAFSSAGVMTGTPTATAGSYTFTLKVVDNAALSATQAYTIAITNATAITTTTLTSAETNLLYSVTLGASGDAAPYSWTVTVGSLPLGMTLTSAGVLSGTPTVASTSNFTVQATGSLGSLATQALSLVVGTETRPCDRNIANNRSEGFVFRRKVAPTDAACVMRGDIWIDTSQNALSISIATAVGPVVWTPISLQAVLSGDGGLLSHLNASQITFGSLPTAVLPSAMSAGTSLATPLVKSDYLELNPTGCATLSAAGTQRFCAEAGTGQLKVSGNGGAYAVLGGSTGTSTTGNVYLDPGPNPGYMKFSLEVDRTADLYSQGFTTVKARKGYLVSLQGGFQQALGLADTNASTDYALAFSTSQDTGATWTRWFGVRQDGLFSVKAFTLETGSKPTCVSGIRGQFWYLAGATTVKDTVEVCAKDAADAYAWRTIY